MFVRGTLSTMTVALLGAGVSLATGAEPGLVAHYRFDEGVGAVAKDSSGRGNHGAIHGATFVKRGQGFLGCHDPRVHVGLGSHTGAVALHVTWPDGRETDHMVEGVDREVTIRYP